MQTREEIVIGSKLDAKGFKQAETALNKLGKSVKQLGAAFGVTFGAKLIVNYSKNAIKAFAEQEAETTRLTQSIKNLGLAFGTDQANAYLNTLEQITGINRDQLQPAYVKILQTTGSLVKTQEILNQSLDVTASTGIDLVTVSQALSQAYVGNTRGLRQLNLGLTKAELASASFADIQTKLTQLFAGQGALAAGTYTAQINKLSIASENASEIIGQALVESLVKLSGSKGVDDLVTKMEKAAEIGAGIIKIFGGGAGELVSQYYAKPSGMSTTLANQDLRASNAAAAKKAEADAKKRAAAILAQQRALTKAAKDTAFVKKASAIFDLAQIQIVAALKGKISEEDKKRLELQMALIAGNADEVTRAANELSKVEGITKGLSIWLKDLPKAKNPFEDWLSYLDQALLKAAQVAAVLGMQNGGISGNGASANAAPMPATNMPVNLSGNNEITIGQGQYAIQAPSGFTTPVINVQVQVAGQDVAAIVSSQQEVQSQSGGYAGQWSSIRNMR